MRSSPPSSPTTAASPPQLFRAALDKVRGESLYPHVEEYPERYPLYEQQSLTSFSHDMDRGGDEPIAHDYFSERRSPIGSPNLTATSWDPYRPWWKRMQRRPDTEMGHSYWIEKKNFDPDAGYGVTKKYSGNNHHERRLLMGSWVAVIFLLFLTIWVICRE